MIPRCLREDPGVGAAVERDADEGVPNTVELFERAGHRTAARASTQHKRAVDVEEKDGFQTWLAFATYVAGARTLWRGLLVETDALAFVELIEVALHGAPVEEPLLSAVVADESEP